jgi:type 1 glutamine amidotransferase
MLTRIERAVTTGAMALCLLAAGLWGESSARAGVEPPAAGTQRVLIISGQGEHDWRSTTPFLRKVLADTGRFDVRVCETPVGLTAQMLADFDVLVDDYAGRALGTDTDNAIIRFVESGKGLVITRGAIGSFTGSHQSEGAKQTGGPVFARLVPAYWSTGPAGDRQPSVQFVDVKIARPEHPIVHGLKSSFKTADALYRGMTVLTGAEVLATAAHDAASGSGKDVPVLLTAGFGNGRVFCSGLGHDLAAMHEKEFITTFTRGTEWAATGTATLPADAGLPRPNADAVRALLITGGHDHETAFYSLFDGYKDLDWLPVAPSTTAFQNDLRGKYDVVIMYDFSRDLDEKGKKNLREFVESGKGVVVLHHALLNYQKWNWWYQDVVGGSYRLSREGTVPSSTVKNNEQIFVTPEGNHPVTTGIAPFHLVDETYGRMWISPNVRPLLSTDNPNSNHVLAWIGPQAGTKVVAIQLGHGHTAFGHPSYRALVHNAILWAAGRIK